MSALAGYTYKALAPYKGLTNTQPQVTVQHAKVLPATATGTLFTVTGSIAVLGLVGVVTTVFSATAVNISLGVTGSNAAIAANPAAQFNATAVGAVLQLPAIIGGVLPAAVVANGSAGGFDQFEVRGTNITITTDATNTGALDWVLLWAPLSRKVPGSVTAP